MPRIPNSPTKRTFMEVIGFTKVIELHPDILDMFDFEFIGFKRIQIMPDVNSLHIFAQEVDGTYWHQILDYPYPDEDESLEDFFGEFAQWFEGEVDGLDLTDVATEGGFYKWADHLGDYIAWERLRAEYQKMKSAFRLMELLGVK